MDCTKTLLLIASISSLLLSINAVPTTRSVIPSYGASSPTASRAGSLIGISTIFKNAQPKATQQVIRVSPKLISFCKNTENPALCAETINPYFQGQFDPIEALETEIRATLNQTLKVSKIISHSLDDKPSKGGVAALKKCKSQYKSIVSTIKEVLELLKEQNVVDAYYKFSTVISHRSSCESAIAEANGFECPFAEESLILYQLSGNCMAIMDGIINSTLQF